MMLQNCQQSCEISVCERAEARHVDCRRDISLWHADQCEMVCCANQLVYVLISTVQLLAAITQ